MVTVRVTYDGDLRCTAEHGPSGQQIRTDAPVDNEGRGEAFSPTDLVGTAMATCVLTILGILARREGISLEGATAVVEKSMIADPRRRIAALPMRVTIPGRLSDREKEKLERAAATCPVHQSLDARVEAPIVFEYPDES
jgi:putative redox protein